MFSLNWREEPTMIARPATGIIESPDAKKHLDVLTAFMLEAELPAFFAVWQDSLESMCRFVEPVVRAGLKTPHVLQPDNMAAELTRLEKRGSLPDDHGIVFLGCLSAMHEEERKQFNAARDRLLRLQTKMIFVESVADEGKVRRDFPDVLSQVSYDCRLFLRAGEEDPFATSDGQRQDSGPTNEAPAALSGTVEAVRADDAVCWLEVGPGTLVKFAVPLIHLRHLDPQPGLELLWSPGNEREAPLFWKREPKSPDPEMIREVRELNQRFREGLKNWKPRSPDNE
jgi:hypothetical protein